MRNRGVFANKQLLFRAIGKGPIIVISMMLVLFISALSGGCTPTNGTVPTQAPVGSPIPLPTNTPLPPRPTNTLAPLTPTPDTPMPDVVAVPNVSGMLAEQASATVQASGFAPQIVYQGANCTSYYVTGQNPPAGSTARHGSPVTISVCPALTVPDVRGVDKGVAANQLQAAGLTPVYAEKTCDSNQVSGQVWATNPGPGNQVSPGTTVTISFYEGCSSSGGGDSGGGDFETP